MTSPSSEATKLRQILQKLQDDLAAVKAGASTQTLDHSSIEVTAGRGYIPIYQNGQEKHRIGRQPDGTITSVSRGNTTPPVVPNLPNCTPGLSTVTVACDGFGKTQYLDFSHINVYVDGVLTGTLMKVPESTVVGPLSYGEHSFALSSVNLSGTESAHTTPVLATPNQVVSNDVAQGIITALQLADNAVTQAKIDAGAVSTEKIVAGAVETLQIAAEAVLADNIAANAITGDKIAANAVTALSIAANAVEAGHIQAGVIDATKLAGQLILASTAIVAGSLTGARIQLDPFGLTQIDENGNLALQLGNTPGGNSLTVIDSTDPTNALATISADGSMSMTGISIDGTATLNGVDLVQFLNNVPGGVVATGQLTTNSPATTSSVGMFELQFDCKAGRLYRIWSSPIYVVGDEVQLLVLATIDGSVPTISSSLITSTICTDDTFTGGDVTGAATTDGHNHFVTYPSGPNLINDWFASSSDCRVRLLFAIHSVYGRSVYATNAHDQISMFVEDIGVVPGLTGGANAGGGSTSANGKHVTTYTPTYCLYAPDTTGTLTTGLVQGMGGTVNYMSMIGLPYATIASNITGATVNKVELYLYSSYWALNAGGTACIGTHNVAGTPTSYSFATRDDVDQAMKKPQGLWITLPTSVAANILAGTVKGLVLDARASHPGTSNFGNFNDLTATDVTTQPAFRVTYTK